MLTTVCNNMTDRQQDVFFDMFSQTPGAWQLTYNYIDSRKVKRTNEIKGPRLKAHAPCKCKWKGFCPATSFHQARRRIAGCVRSICHSYKRR